MVVRTTDVEQMVREWAMDFQYLMTQGLRSARIQWDVEGTTDPLTLYSNKSGVFIVEPGHKPMPASEWLEAS